MRVALVLVVLLVAGCLDGSPDAGTQPSPTPTATGPAPASPSATPSSTPAPSPTPTRADPAGVVEANEAFGRDLLRVLSAEKAGEDLVLSPYSIATALQMVYGAANGTTRDAMRDALGLAGVDATLDEEARTLREELTASDPNVTLRIGNSVWTEASYHARGQDEFSKRIATYYDGEMFSRDFADPATVDEINAWASERTEGKIPKVLDEIRRDEVMFLLNAVYFNGTWTRGFNASCTHDAPFTKDDGRRTTVDMMCGAEPGHGHRFSRDAERTVARLPYGDGRFAMYLVLPPAGTPLDAFLATWDGNVSGPYDGNVLVELPRFDLATRSLDLEPALTALGMGVAFTDRADFTRLGDSLALSRVIHDAVLEVDERGTVAAAVTTVGAVLTSVPPPPTTITFDRPFALAIRDDETGATLFAAKVHDPTAG